MTDRTGTKWGYMARKRGYLARFAPFIRKNERLAVVYEYGMGVTQSD